jgi:hypothetical protein
MTGAQNLALKRQAIVGQPAGLGKGVANASDPKFWTV